MRFFTNTLNLLIVLLILNSCGVAKHKSENNESLQKPIYNSDYSVAIIDNCGHKISIDDKTYSLFPGYDNTKENINLNNLNFSGWNHASNGSATEWGNLKLPSNDYDFNNIAKVNRSCNNFATLNMILLKKIADWNHQHANGFECKILAQGYKFGDIKNVVFDIKINSAKTNIPSVESLKKNYSRFVDESDIQAMDDGKVNIGITLCDNTNLNGTIIIQLDQLTMAGQWVRVIIPMNKLLFYQEVNYKKTNKTLEDLKNMVINRILIVGETKNGTVLRAKIANWNTTVPETFKEMDLSFKKIELELK